MQLLQPAWAAEWVVTASPGDMLSDGDGSDGAGPPPPPGPWSVVALEYKVPRHGKTLRARQVCSRETLGPQTGCAIASEKLRRSEG